MVAMSQHSENLLRRGMSTEVDGDAMAAWCDKVTDDLCKLRENFRCKTRMAEKRRRDKSGFQQQQIDVCTDLRLGLGKKGHGKPLCSFQVSFFWALS